MNTRIARSLLVLGLMLAVAGAANADTLMFDGTIYDIYFTTPVAVGDGSEGLVAFTIRAVNTTGEAGYDPTSFDGSRYGYTGISGVLHHHYDKNAGPSVITRTVGAAATVAGHNSIDTQFLVDETATVAVPLTEDYLYVTPHTPPVGDGDPGDAGYSAEGKFGYYGVTLFGDNLTGALAIDNVGATWDIAQVVTNDINSIEAFFFLSGTTAGEIIQIPVPEPATMGLLALGGLALLKRRN